MAQHVETTTIHTIHITLEDQVLAGYSDGDEVRVVFHSRAKNRPMVPIRLSYAALERLTRDY